MIKIRFHKKETHYVYVDNPSSKSYASYILLKNEYIKHEYENFDESDFTYNIGQKVNWATQLAFNLRFLNRQKELYGSLTCVYCYKKDLVIDTKNRSILATADHLIAKANGGHPLDEANLVVACYTCNHNKGSKDGYIVNGKYKF
jgi:5-methylcytosine-specific restriction endonuclease McrA